MAWLYQIKHQELGWRTVLRTTWPAARCWLRPATSCPSGECDRAAIGEPGCRLPGLARAQRARRPVVGPGELRAPPRQGAPASLVGGWYDLFLPAQVADYEALRRAGRRARLTIGPWTHSSPGLFAETVRDGPAWWEERLGEHGHREPRAPGARLRHGLARPGRSSPCGRRRERPSGGTSGAGARWHRGAGRERARPLPLQPARPDAGRRRCRAQHGHGGPQGAAPPRAPPRRAHLHQSGAARGPHRDRPADRHAVRPLVARAHRLLRAPVRREREGQVLQPERRHRPAAARARCADEDGVSGSRSRCGRRRTPSGPATASASRSRAAPTRSFCRNTGTGEPLATGANLRSADQEVFHDAGRPSSIALPVVRLIGDDPLPVREWVRRPLG